MVIWKVRPKEHLRPVPFDQGLPLRGRNRGRIGGSLLFVGLADVEHLIFAAAVAVDGQALAAGLVGQQKGVFHILGRGVMAEVDGLADRVVGVALEGGLDVDVVLRRNVVGGLEELAVFEGDLLDALQAAGMGDFFDQFHGIKAVFPGDLLEDRIDLEQLVVVHYPAHVGNGEQRFDAAGAAGQDGDGAGGGDGGAGGVAYRLLGVLQAVNRIGEIGEGAPGLAELAGLGKSLVVDKAHDLFGDLRLPPAKSREGRAGSACRQNP